MDFRFAIYRGIFFPEKSKTWSLMTGLSYRYWKGAVASPSTYSGVLEEHINFKRQVVSLIPIGINFHGTGKFIRPFVYAGVGFALIIDTNRIIVNHVDKGNKNELDTFPIALNMGAGAKIKVGSNYLIVEVTPTATSAGTFVNVGYCF